MHTHREHAYIYQKRIYQDCLSLYNTSLTISHLSFISLTLPSYLYAFAPISYSICFLFLCLSLCVYASPFFLSLSHRLYNETTGKGCSFKVSWPHKGRDTGERAAILLLIAVINDLLQVWELFVSFSPHIHTVLLSSYVSCKAEVQKRWRDRKRNTFHIWMSITEIQK